MRNAPLPELEQFGVYLMQLPCDPNGLAMILKIFSPDLNANTGFMLLNIESKQA
jgi:hypothetical protein